ncbi:nucleotidyltransferase domain-containing protein [Candidatus Dojkabacteria bacterium]|nr:nucleotidyltransferase domain-containing protein [Candidatus Dojkabacteria bacterium]
MNPTVDGYEKLLGIYKELEEVNSHIVEFMKSEFPVNSTLIAWGAVTYGSYVPGRSDFDFLIVTQEPVKIEEIRRKLQVDCFKYTRFSAKELDIVVTNLDSLKRGDLRGITADGIREFSDVEIYIISHFGKILVGDEEALELFPKRQLKDFYGGVVERFRKEVQKRLINRYERGGDVRKFIEKNILYVILMYRILFTHINNEIWGKVESIDWVVYRLNSENTGALKELGEITKQIYLLNGDYEMKNDHLRKLINKAVWEFLELTKTGN